MCSILLAFEAFSTKSWVSRQKIKRSGRPKPANSYIKRAEIGFFHSIKRKHFEKRTFVILHLNLELNVDLVIEIKQNWLNTKTANFCVSFLYSLALSLDFNFLNLSNPHAGRVCSHLKSSSEKLLAVCNWLRTEVTPYRCLSQHICEA